MAIGFSWNFQNIWPFSAFKHDDLRLSKDIVHKLSIPEHMKQFVYAVRNPKNESVIYVLSTLNLSERSALDAECLIREVKPDAVVALVGLSSVTEIQLEERALEDAGDTPVPTSSFGVIKRSFVNKISKEEYEHVAGSYVLREIFGISFYGHILSAKRVADEVGSSFVVIQPPFTKSFSDGTCGEVGNMFQGLVKSLVPQKVSSLVPSSSKRFCISNDVQLQMVKALYSCVDQSIQMLDQFNKIETISKEIQPTSDYEVPPFAKSVYPLLEDLHNVFSDLPSIGKALGHAQRMLFDVSKGENVDTGIISEVYTFRLAVEGLRVALNNSGRLPIDKRGTPANIEFSQLPLEDKSHALYVQALRSQTEKFRTIVAVVDASVLAGLRKHWNNPVCPEVVELSSELVINCNGEGDILNSTGKKWLLTGKPAVAVGAGATAIFGASSLSKVITASTLIKVMSFKVPVSLKLFLCQTNKAMAIVFSKTLGPSKVVFPGFASSGAKTTSVLKATASAEKIRTVARSVIASAENTSFSAMRTAFYEIMRTRRVRPPGFLPWATFLCSVGTCSGLLMYGNGIECAAESLPSAPSIASLGRGIHNLHKASEVVMQTEANRIQKSVESLIYRLKRSKVQ